MLYSYQKEHENNKKRRGGGGMCFNSMETKNKRLIRINIIGSISCGDLHVFIPGLTCNAVLQIKSVGWGLGFRRHC